MTPQTAKAALGERSCLVLVWRSRSDDDVVRLDSVDELRAWEEVSPPSAVQIMTRDEPANRHIATAARLDYDAAVGFQDGILSVSATAMIASPVGSALRAYDWATGKQKGLCLLLVGFTRSDSDGLCAQFMVAVSRIPRVFATDPRVSVRHGASLDDADPTELVVVCEHDAEGSKTYSVFVHSLLEPVYVFKDDAPLAYTIYGLAYTEGLLHA